MLNVHRNRKAYLGRGEVGGGGGGSGRLYTHRYTVTTRMTSALRWAAMRAILMFHNCEGRSHKTVSTDHNLSKEKGEPKRNRAQALLLTSLTPYRWAKPALNCCDQDEGVLL